MKKRVFERKEVSIEVLREIADRRRRTGESVNTIAREMDISGNTLMKYLREADLYERVDASLANPRKDVPNLEEIARRRREEGTSLVALAAECGVSDSTLRKRMQEANLLQEVDATEFPVDAIAERYREGETLAELSSELGISSPTLKKRLDEEGLLASREVRLRPSLKVLSRIPQDLVDEIVLTYEGSEALAEVTSPLLARLRSAGFSANAHWVEAVLDWQDIIRHPGDEPSGRTAKPVTALTRDDMSSVLGWLTSCKVNSVAEVAEKFGVDESALIDRLRFDGHDVPTRTELAILKLNKVSYSGYSLLEDLAFRFLVEDALLAPLAKEAGVRPKVLVNCWREARLIPPGPLNQIFEFYVDVFADRYGNGEDLESLARELCLPVAVVRFQFEQAGFLAEAERKRSSIPNKRTPDEISLNLLPHEEIVERHRRGESVAAIAYDLRRQWYPASEQKVQEVLEMYKSFRLGK